MLTQKFSGSGLLLSVGDQTSGLISNKYDALSRWAGQTCPAMGGAGPYEITVINGTGGLPASVISVGGTVGRTGSDLNNKHYKRNEKMF